jgi:hypothetical protein
MKKRKSGKTNTGKIVRRPSSLCHAPPSSKKLLHGADVGLLPAASDVDVAIGEIPSIRQLARLIKARRDVRPFGSQVSSENKMGRSTAAQFRNKKTFGEP